VHHARPALSRAQHGRRQPKPLQHLRSTCRHACAHLSQAGWVANTEAALPSAVAHTEAVLPSTAADSPPNPKTPAAASLTAHQYSLHPHSISFSTTSAGLGQSHLDHSHTNNFQAFPCTRKHQSACMHTKPTYPPLLYRERSNRVTTAAATQRTAYGEVCRAMQGQASSAQPPVTTQARSKCKSHECPVALGMLHAARRGSTTGMCAL